MQQSLRSRTVLSLSKSLPHNLSLLCLAILLLFAAPVALASSGWYVDGVNGDDNNDCKSTQTACKTIGHAISLAASGDSIRVAAATYTERLVIHISLKILGSGAKTTILDGLGRFGPMVTISSTTAHVALSGVTITNGTFLTGAGITNQGVLLLRQSAVSGNRVSLIGCQNCAAVGGGINNQSGAILIIGNSTVSDNHVSLSGCQHNCSEAGGGIYNNGRLVLYNSTISGNTASPFGQGSGIYSGGTATISNSTIAGNGGVASAIHGAAAIENSVVANVGISNCSGTVTSNGYNLSSDNSCHFNNTGDLSNTDPKLGKLGYHGGPTQTIPLLSGSPAIDAGSPAGCTDGQGHLLMTDQRGAPRPDKEDLGIGCDMGAYERQKDLSNDATLSSGVGNGYCLENNETLTGECIAAVIPNTCSYQYDGNPTVIAQPGPECPPGLKATPATFSCMPHQIAFVDAFRRCTVCGGSCRRGICGPGCTCGKDGECHGPNKEWLKEMLWIPEPEIAVSSHE